jgi:hypothetical protein
VEFRWLILITLWTTFIGPVFDQPPRAQTRAARQEKAVRLAPPAAIAQLLPY